MKKTKIVCTLGPASDTKEIISAMAEAGMNVVRLNFSHGTHADHAIKIKTVKEVRTEKKIPLPIMLDTKGPAFLPAALAPAIRRRRVSFLKKKKDIIIILLSENDTLPSNF